MVPRLPPLVSGSLPPPQQQGALPLGHAYLRTAPISQFSTPSPTLTSTGRPALEIREVAYTVFYPRENDKKGLGKWVSWVIEPTSGVVEGYAKFIGKSGLGWMLIGAAAGRISFPASPLAPLAPSSSKYPLIIFSHGLAGTRNTYSQYCAALAASGNVVLAIEHRDGSGPAILNPTEDGKGELMTYLQMEDLTWAKGENPSKDRLRSLQLDMRLQEVYETYHTFKRLVSNPEKERSRTKIKDEKAKEPITTEFLGSLSDRIDFENVHLTGHSFGGGTMLHLLQSPSPKDPLLPPIPVNRCIALDPWVEPLPLPAPSSHPKDAPRVPILCINSPGFTEWSTHFHRLFNMIKKVDGSFLSLLGSSHQSFSDFPLLYPGSTTFALSLLTTSHELSHAFIHGKLAESPLLKDKKVDNGDYERNGDGKMAGEKGEVVVHLLGKED